MKSSHYSNFHIGYSNKINPAQTSSSNCNFFLMSQALFQPHQHKFEPKSLAYNLSVHSIRIEKYKAGQIYAHNLQFTVANAKRILGNVYGIFYLLPSLQAAGIGTFELTFMWAESFKIFQLLLRFYLHFCSQNIMLIERQTGSCVSFDYLDIFT